MLSRRCAFRASRAAMQVPLATQRRMASGSFLSNIIAHDMGLLNAATYTSVGTLAMSPIGTTALVAVAYNTCVVGLKHLWYTLEMLTRDYLQDPQLVQVARYMILMSLIICCAQLFIEA